MELGLQNDTRILDDTLPDELGLELFNSAGYWDR